MARRKLKFLNGCMLSAHQIFKPQSVITIINFIAPFDQNDADALGVKERFFDQNGTSLTEDARRKKASWPVSARWRTSIEVLRAVPSRRIPGADVVCLFASVQVCPVGFATLPGS